MYTMVSTTNTFPFDPDKRFSYILRKAQLDFSMHSNSKISQLFSVTSYI